MSRTCRKCGTEFQPKEHQVSRGCYQCRPCRAKECREYRERRKAEGRPVLRNEDRAKKMARQATPEYKAKAKARDAVRYYKNPEYHIDKARRWQSKNRQKCAARTAIWRANNPEKYRRLLVKKDLAESMGVSCRYVSDEILDAKLAQLDVKRLIRQLDK